jgi:Cu-Zn family superoxide dismutase
MKTNLRGFTSMTLLALAGLIAGCGGDDDTTGSGGSGGTGGSGGGGAGGGDAAETKIASSMGDWNVYRDPYGDGGASPIMTVQGSAEAFSIGAGKMRIKLSVSGLPATRPFGSHVHKLACEDNKAGTHYQHNPAPDGGATDPMYANAMNEVWLDFTTDASGAATKETTVDFIPRTGEAKSVVIHDQLTMTGGLAGAKLACINMNF